MPFRLLSASARVVLCTGGLLLAGAAAQAQTPAASAQSERARCESGASGQDLAACRKEVGAAQVEARRGNLTTPAAGQQSGNASDRCGAQTGGAREDCLKRTGAESAGAHSTTTSSGSVQGGGIIRETTTVIPAPSR